ncbi:hypothetical protein Tco_0293923 [Tanacetum coccineum]
MACALPHTDSEVEALVQRLINEDKGRQDVLLNLAFQFEDSCAVRDDLRKAYEKCNDISQESRALICTLLKESSEKDRKLHLSMYGKAAQLEKQMDAKLAWFQEKYSGVALVGWCRSLQMSDSSVPFCSIIILVVFLRCDVSYGHIPIVKFYAGDRGTYWKEASQLFVEGLSVVDELYGVQVVNMFPKATLVPYTVIPYQRQYILLFQKDLFNFAFFKLALGGITAHVRLDLDMGTHWHNSWSIQGVVEP